MVPSASEETAERKTIVVDTQYYTATFDTLGGRLTGFQLKKYHQEKKSLAWGDLIPALPKFLHGDPADENKLMEMAPPSIGGTHPFDVRLIGEDTLSQRLRNTVYHTEAENMAIASGSTAQHGMSFRTVTRDGLAITKRFSFVPDSYIIHYEVTITNTAAHARSAKVATLFGEGSIHAQAPSSNFVQNGPMWRSDGDLEQDTPEDAKNGLFVEKPQWIGITDNYFLSAALPESAVSHGLYEAVSRKVDEDDFWVASYGLVLPDVTLAPNQSVSGRFRVFMGPKDVDEMTKFGGKLEEAQDLTLEFLAQPLLSLMRWFYGFTGNYGIAIILVTIIVRLVLFPLSYKGMLSMKKMQKLQPRVAALKEKFKDDKERFQKEMMALYRKQKMNPLGGCLPIMLQIPIFIALYQALLGAIELRHSPFMFWIVDLSAKDGLYITPLLMGISMIVQQKLTPTSLDPTQARIMSFMPWVFMFFMINFPAGLVVYWFTSNVLGILQQLAINRIKVPELKD